MNQTAHKNTMNHLQEKTQSPYTGHAEEIAWRETEAIFLPILRPLPDFLSGVQLASQGSLPSWEADESLLTFFDQGCMKQMLAHACGDISQEQAGILSGQVYVDAGRHYINITSTYPADTVGDATHFRFHQDCWEKIWQQLRDGENILGWYHTHPGLGVFLSPTDLRTQQTHFRRPWSVAVVIDPTTRETGVFAGSRGTKVRETSCFSYLRVEAEARVWAPGRM